MEINRSEVLRYLGYRNQKIEAELDNLIDSCINEIKGVSNPFYTYRIFDIEPKEDEVRVLETDLILKGKDISSHLKHSKKCAILAATLGVSVDNRIRVLGKTDTTRAVILDSCATEAIESICNMVESQIKGIAEKEGLDINFRYSPGYGDLPINVQPGILNVLNAQNKIGLTCTENFILLPRKSVTAIIGFVEEGKKEVKKGCKTCRAYNNCLYRRDGISCGI
jgi:hypothetical protein